MTIQKTFHIHMAYIVLTAATLLLTCLEATLPINLASGSDSEENAQSSSGERQRVRVDGTTYEIEDKGRGFLTAYSHKTGEPFAYKTPHGILGMGHQRLAEKIFREYENKGGSVVASNDSGSVQPHLIGANMPGQRRVQLDSIPTFQRSCVIGYFVSLRFVNTLGN